MSSILHRWDDKGVCQFCGVKVLDVSVNGGLFCAGSAEGRKGPASDGDPKGPPAASGGGFGFFGVPQQPIPSTGAPAPQGGAQGQTTGSASATPSPTHDWDSQGFCKLCRLGMYAVKQLNLPCRPVPQGATIPAPAGYIAAHGGHGFRTSDGRCVNCGYDQKTLTHFDCDCASAQRAGPPVPPYARHPSVGPFTPDVPQDAPAKSPYLIQTQRQWYYSSPRDAKPIVWCQGIGWLGIDDEIAD